MDSGGCYTPITPPDRVISYTQSSSVHAFIKHGSLPISKLYCLMGVTGI